MLLVLTRKVYNANPRTTFIEFKQPNGVKVYGR